MVFTLLAAVGLWFVCQLGLLNDFNQLSDFGINLFQCCTEQDNPCARIIAVCKHLQQRAEGCPAVGLLMASVSSYRQ